MPVHRRCYGDPVTPRQPVPTIWLMTDERMGADLWPALERLPRGAGVVFRHHRTPTKERARLRRRLVAVARRHGLVLVGTEKDDRCGGGVHGRRGRGLITWPAHDRAEAVAGWRAGATVLFVSPVFATRTHPGACALGPLRAATIARGLSVTRIALGGMTARRFRTMRRFGFEGWAAIDAWRR